MEQGQKQSFTRLTENTRNKIFHAPNTRSKERIQYSSDDILGESISSGKDAIITNVKEPDPQFDEELNKTKEILKNSVIIRPFNKDNKLTTCSVVLAVMVSIILLSISTYKANHVHEDPYAINPETGLTNQETRWNTFTDMIRYRVIDLSDEESDLPQKEVIQYFDELLEDYSGVADRMDILTIKGSSAQLVGKN